MQAFNTKPILQAVCNPVTEKHELKLFVLRLDLLHQPVNGNKYFKLKYNIAEAIKTGKDTLLTFGGAYSNHIAATATAAREAKLNSIGFIRGEEHVPLNKTLELATKNGMRLNYLPREEYRALRENNFEAEYSKSFANCYVIPEGGSNKLAVQGCMEINDLLPNNTDYICAACGTGATFAGILLGKKLHQQAIGFQVLKAENYISAEVKKWLTIFEQEYINGWSINENYHFGGYAKTNDELNKFIIDFENQTQMPIESVYTGKMMFGIFDLIQQNYFPKGANIVAIHSGGLQGKQ
jgi:1-aminocyclopropane-1-carboxylate deaminase